MNYNGGGGGENGDDFGGLGEWAYQDQQQTSGTYNSSTERSNPLYTLPLSRSQQYPTSRGSSAAQINFIERSEARRSAPSIYTSPPTQSSAPYYVVPSIASEVDPMRSYADVVSRGRRLMASSAYAAPQQFQNYQHVMRSQPSQQSSHLAAGPYNISQARSQQAPSYAEVAARGQAQIYNLRQAYSRTTNRTTFGQFSSHQNSQLGLRQVMYGGPDTSAYLGGDIYRSLPGDVATTDSWTFDSTSDFNLYDDPMDRFIQQPTTFVAPGSLVINPSSTASPVRQLLSPVDSIDASSVTSSTRRSKREIMSENSGPFKCQHQQCTAGFNTPDDRRYNRYFHM